MGQEAAKLMGPHICCTVTFDRCGLVKQTKNKRKHGGMFLALIISPTIFIKVQLLITTIEQKLLDSIFEYTNGAIYIYTR